MCNLTNKTEEEIATIAAEYYSGRKSSSELIEEYHLEAKGKNRYIHNHFPPLKTADKCVYCGNDIYFTYPSKTEANRYHGEKNVLNAYKCKKCGHMPLVDYCNCDSCNKKREEEQKKIEEELKAKQEIQRQLLQEKFPNPTAEECTGFNEIYDLQDRIIIGAVIENTLDDSFRYTKSYDSEFCCENNKTLTPSLVWDKEIYYNIMPIYFRVAGNSKLDAFNLEDFRYYPFKVNWYPCFTDIITNKSLDNILSMPNLKCEDDLIVILQLWKRILLEELTQDFITQINEVGFGNYKIGEKTKNRLALLLEKMPLSKIVNIIFNTTNHAYRFYQRNNITKKHAANTVIGRTESYVDKAIENNWEIRDSFRNKNCPQSALSVYFFHYIVPIFEKSFYTIPSLDIIKKFYNV